VLAKVGVFFLRHSVISMTLNDLERPSHNATVVNFTCKTHTVTPMSADFSD